MINNSEELGHLVLCVMQCAVHNTILTARRQIDAASTCYCQHRAQVQHFPIRPRHLTGIVLGNSMRKNGEVKVALTPQSHSFAGLCCPAVKVLAQLLHCIFFVQPLT